MKTVKQPHDAPKTMMLARCDLPATPEADAKPAIHQGLNEVCSNICEQLQTGQNDLMILSAHGDKTGDLALSALCELLAGEVALFRESLLARLAGTSRAVDTKPIHRARPIFG